MNDEPLSFLTLDRTLLAELSAAARLHPRRRLNRNLHAMDDPSHRLLNAIEPGSYVRPHRHGTPPKSETIVLVAGAVGLVIFDGIGTILGRQRLDAGGERFGADLGPDVWHTLVSLSEGTVFFETKPGPYVKPVEADLAPWAPEEGTGESEKLERAWRDFFIVSS